MYIEQSVLHTSRWLYFLWKYFESLFQIQSYLRQGMPSHLRGAVWKQLLDVDVLRITATFNYKVINFVDYSWHRELSWLGQLNNVSSFLFTCLLLIFLHYLTSSVHFIIATLKENLIIPDVLIYIVHSSVSKAQLVAVREQLVDMGISEYGGSDTVTHLCEMETEGFLKYIPGHIKHDCLRQILLDLGKSWNNNYDCHWYR